MKRLVKFPLQEGDFIWVEVDLPEPISGIAPAGRIDEAYSRAAETLEGALDKSKSVAGAIISRLRTLSDTPDEIAVKFGIKLSAEAGAVLAASGVEANYEVALKWSKKRKPNDEDA